MVIVFVIIINISVTFIKIANFKKDLAGYASNNGFVNVTISSIISIELLRDTIDWGAGVINGTGNATLYTNGDGNGTVLRGNWSGNNVSALVVRNTGNVNCSVKIQSSKNAHELFGSISYSNEQYMFNVSNRKPNSCYGNLLNQWVDVNKTVPGTKFCEQFNSNPGNNEIFIDVLLSVPSDPADIGRKSDVITITADVSS